MTDGDPGPIELKPLSADALTAALARARHYRLLSQPHLAESIFRDILAVDPEHGDARVGLIMALCDDFGSEHAHPVNEVLKMASELEDEYSRSYYMGLVCERKAQAYLYRGCPGSGSLAYDWFRRAMDHYADAEPVRPSGNDDALLRWNTCARTINERHDVAPRLDDEPLLLLE